MSYLFPELAFHFTFLINKTCVLINICIKSNYDNNTATYNAFFK